MLYQPLFDYYQVEVGTRIRVERDEREGETTKLTTDIDCRKRCDLLIPLMNKIPSTLRWRLHTVDRGAEVDVGISEANN